MTTSPSRARRLAAALAPTALFVLLTVWFTWPQVLSMDQVTPHQDPMFSTWRLAWVAHQLPRDPLHLLDANILYPARGTAAYSDAALLLGTIAAPLLWLGVPAVIAYNVMILLSFVTAALGAWLLVRELTGSSAAGIVAGIIFAFCPFRFEHYWHLELIWSCWIPLTLWALHRTIATTSWRHGILTGLFIAAQVFSCIYLAVFLATWVGVLGLLFVAFRILDLRSRAIPALLVGAMLAGALVAPYGAAYTESSRIVGTRSAAETTYYSAVPKNYLSSPPTNALYGWTMERWGANEMQLFPGVTAVVLALIGLWPPFNRLRLIYALATLFAFDLSLGLNGFSYGPLREAVTFFQGLRVTARAATLVQLGLAVLGGYGIARLMRVRELHASAAVPASAAAGASASGEVPAPAAAPVPAGALAAAAASGAPTPAMLESPPTVVSSATPRNEPQSGRAAGARLGLSAAVVAVVCVLLVIEYTNSPLPLVKLPTKAPQLHRWLAQQTGHMVLLHLPVPRADRLPGEDPRYEFLSTFHWQKMVNGYSAFVPPRYFRLMEAMVSFPDARAIEAIRMRGVTHLVIHPALYPQQEGLLLIEELRTSPDFAWVGWFPDGLTNAAVFRVTTGGR